MQNRKYLRWHKAEKQSKKGNSSSASRKHQKAFPSYGLFSPVYIGLFLPPCACFSLVSSRVLLVAAAACVLD